MSTQTQSPFLVRVTRDHLLATIVARGDAELSNVSPGDVVAALEAAKVAVDDQVTRRIQEYTEALRSPDGPPEGEFQIAAGRPPTEGEDGTFTWDDSLQQQATEWDDDLTADFYNIFSIVTVEADAVIGRVHPPVAGTEGQDVRANPLRPKRKLRQVVLKSGVKLGEDGQTVMATVPGKVVYQDYELSICELVEIAGDVDFETGNLDLATDVVVRGTVRDLFGVKTKKSITVWGTVEAADIQAVGNVTVRGGILGRAKGEIVAGGEIVAKFCAEANLRAGGDIRLGREAMNSRVHTEGRLLLPQGALISGEVFARQGMEVGTLGSGAGAPTKVAVGLHPEEITQTAEENDKRRAAVEKIRQTVGPLMGRLERLTDQQREKATELMCRADSIQAQIEESQQRVSAMLSDASDQNEPYVLVSSRIHPRVSISIADRLVTFHEELKGPVRIQRRKIENQTVIVAVSQLSGSVTELNSYRL